jgi:hypothetical protein
VNYVCMSLFMHGKILMLIQNTGNVGILCIFDECMQNA